MTDLVNKGAVQRFAVAWLLCQIGPDSYYRLNDRNEGSVIIRQNSRRSEGNQARRNLVEYNLDRRRIVRGTRRNSAAVADPESDVSTSFQTLAADLTWLTRPAKLSFGASCTWACAEIKKLIVLFGSAFRSNFRR